MNKTIIITSATIMGLVGGAVPFLFGDTDPFSGWSIFIGTIGGFVGIWLGVVISNRVG
ncbi:MAG: hypothetical protein JWN26_277 [Candidatus Saccharibacteria bacterium]|jgi:hypothetical protein|nr:hypothetical protein [Candidatus Saccharibacteria bacterium]